MDNGQWTVDSRQQKGNEAANVTLPSSMADSEDVTHITDDSLRGFSEVVGHGQRTGV